MHFFYAPDVTGNKIYTLSEKESHHIIHVLRSEIGDTIYLTDGKGIICEAKLTDITKKKGVVEIVSQKQHPPKKNKLHIAIAPPKTGERLDFLLEKLTELGADKITPLLTQNSERRKFDRDKELHTLIAAIKQSANPFLPELQEMTDFKKFILSDQELSVQKFICHCRSNMITSLSKLYKPLSNVLICIGPEGDFTEEELTFAQTNRFIPASLGNRILRTETAAMSSCMIVNTINQLNE